MKISRQKDNGFNVKEAFAEALEAKPIHWKQNTFPPQSSDAYDNSFWSKLTSCFQSPLKCNPGVQIDFRGKNIQIKENQQRTQFIMNPKSASIRFKDEEGVIQYEFDDKHCMDPDAHYLVIQVLDNEIERESQDRVIAECLLTFCGFKSKQTNYAKISIYDSVKGDESGIIMLHSTLRDHKLQIVVEEIINLSDPTAELVKDDSTFKRDIIIFIAWFIYMALSIIFYILSEHFTFINALYLRIVTAFTVGYGDLYPVTNAGKLLNSLFIIVDTATIGFMTSKLMNYILRFREIQKEKKDTAKRKRQKELKDIDEEEHKYDEEDTKETENKVKTSNLWRDNKLYLLGAIIVVFIAIGTCVMVYVEGYDTASAFEWNFVTLSTVGYGDVTPQTTPGKVFTIFYIIFGVSLVVYFGTAIFEKLDERRQRKFKEQVMRRALISEAQLLEFDVDGDGKINKYEFLSKMLVETQEVEQSKIDEIMTKFKMLDADGSGTITTEELQEIEQSGR